MSGPHHRKLWLWRNFVDGIPEYWAFGNAYPCRLGGGDPLVFGEPCGYALHIESSVGRDYDDDEVLATVMRANAMQHEAELATLRARAERAEAELDELRRDSNRAWQRASEVEEERDHLIIYKMNAQSTIADLNGQVERLREVLRAVDEWDLNWADGLDANVERIKDIVRAALGGEKSTAPAFTLPPETPPPE